MPHRRWLRILPVAFVMYTIAFTNRVNISLALPSMIRDLHMDPMQAGSAAGVFFWGYLVLQIPGGHLARRWSAKHFVSILLLTWGICSVGCGLVQTGQQLSVMRFLLGLAQGGVWPATLVLLSNWFPRAERARANTFWMLCLPAAMVLSLPLSGWILDQWGWRVMLIAEGALPLVWLPVWMKFIDDDPHRARWISSEEREYLDTTLRREYAELETVDPKPSLRYLLHPQVLVMAFLLFLDAGGFYGYLFWLPSILGSTKTSSNLLIGILSAVPFPNSWDGNGPLFAALRQDGRTAQPRGNSVRRGWGASTGQRATGPKLACAVLCFNLSRWRGGISFGGTFLGHSDGNTSTGCGGLRDGANKRRREYWGLFRPVSGWLSERTYGKYLL